MLKLELNFTKIRQFAVHNSTLEEVFENREQIEISKNYERLPKPTSIAIREWLDDRNLFPVEPKKNKRYSLG